MSPWLRTTLILTRREILFVLKKDEVAKLRAKLTPEQADVCVNKGTEMPFTGEYCNNHEKGVYRCAVCGAELFDSATKFESGTGWPSFWQPAKKENVKEKDDYSYDMHRVEAECAELRFPSRPRLRRRARAHQAYATASTPSP